MAPSTLVAVSARTCAPQRHCNQAAWRLLKGLANMLLKSAFQSPFSDVRALLSGDQFPISYLQSSWILLRGPTRLPGGQFFSPNNRLSDLFKSLCPGAAPTG